MNCKICQHATIHQFVTRVLDKYDVHYYKCPRCSFLQTEYPFWLPESYEEAITDLDIGYVARNISLSEIVTSVIKLTGNTRGRFVDYGGGYGLFVRLLRDKGFDFYRQDTYCKNIFARNFDVKDRPLPEKFDMLTAFEVFEHLEDPLSEIEKMFEYADTLLFSTALQPNRSLTNPNEWWYIAPETGQHISFYHRSTLEYLAQRFQCNLYTDGSGLHMLTKERWRINVINLISRFYWLRNRLLSRHFHGSRGLMAHDSRIAKESLKVKQAKQGIKLNGKSLADSDVTPLLATE